MFLTVNKDVLTMLMKSLAGDAAALGSIKVEVESQVKHSTTELLILSVCQGLSHRPSQGLVRGAVELNYLSPLLYPKHKIHLVPPFPNPLDGPQEC